MSQLTQLSMLSLELMSCHKFYERKKYEKLLYSAQFVTRQFTHFNGVSEMLNLKSN